MDHGVCVYYPLGRMVNHYVYHTATMRIHTLLQSMHKLPFYHPATMRIYPHQSVYVCYTLISPHFSAKLCVLTPHELCVHIPHLPPLFVCVCLSN